jgi:phage protein U
MFLSFGDFIFEKLVLPQSWSQTYETIYSQVPIIGGKPIVQGTGEKLIEPEISCFLASEFCDIKKTKALIQGYRERGVVHTLLGGDGIDYGKFVIVSIGESYNRSYDSNGFVSGVSLAIKFLEYNSNETSEDKTGLVVTSQSPRPQEPIQPIPSIPISLSKDMQEATLATASISKASKSSTPKYTQIVKACDNANAVWTSVNNKVQDTKKIIRRAADLKDSVDNVKSALAAVKQASQAKNLHDLYAANTVLERAVYHANSAGVPVAAFVACRETGK